MDPVIVSALVRAEEWDALKRYVETFELDDESADDSKPSGKGLTLNFNDIVFDVEGFSEEDLRKVVEVNLSAKSRDEACPISEDNLAVISKFFQENELPYLATLRVDNRPNTNDVLQRIFGSAETKKSLFSLSQISAIIQGLKDGVSLSKDTIECIFHHFKDYPRLMRSDPVQGVYRDKGGIHEEYVAPLTICINTSGMGTYLPWFTGDYRDGTRVSKDRRFKCRYTTWKGLGSTDDVPLYIKIQVTH